MAYNKPEEEEITFVDAEDYRSQPQGAMTYEQIVLTQIRRCSEEGSKEMVGGYVKEKQTSKGVVEVYVPDQRDIYIQCITMLHDLLLAWFDDEMNKDVETFNSKLESAREQKVELLKQSYNATRDKYIRNQIVQQINTGFVDRDSYPARQFMEDKLQIYRYLFQKLMLLYGRQRYLMAQAIDDSLDYK